MSRQESLYSALADLVLVVHFAFVSFVLFGLIAVWVGRFCGWSWVRNFWFRLVHVMAIGVVVGESIGGVVCPLTNWEAKLRMLAGGGERYAGSFIQHWVHRLMFFEASERSFTIIYVVFFTAVLASFWLVKPRWPRKRAAG